MKTIIATCSLIFLIGVSCRRKPSMDPVSCCPKVGISSDISPAGPLDARTSIYQLPGLWTDQHDRSLELSRLKGKVQVMAMIFTHCGYACPRIVQDMKAIQDSLPDAEKNNVGFVLVSFDTQRDDPAQLQRFAEQQALDGHWILLHGSSRQVRELSMLLDIKYRQTGDNGFTHSNSILILDNQGTVRTSLDGLEPQTGTAIDLIHRLTAG